VVWLAIFSPLRGTNSIIKHCLLSYFSAQFPKRYRKSPTVELLRLKTLRRAYLVFPNSWPDIIIFNASSPNKQQQKLLIYRHKKFKYNTVSTCIFFQIQRDHKLKLRSNLYISIYPLLFRYSSPSFEGGANLKI